MTTAAVLLAAGSGRRFDGATPKLLAPFRGRALVLWALEHAAAAGLDDLLVVTGAIDLTGVPLPPTARLVANPRHAEGQSTSVAAGLDAAEAAGHDAVVIGLADQPLVPPEAWRLVAAATATPIAVATYDGQRRNPLRFAADVWPRVRQELQGDEGARRVLAKWPELVTEVTCPGSAVDIDTTEDLQQWNL